jgi:Repeat of unknown function (DUF6923)/HYDIN/CFA65/VesB-like, Ig-like domain/IPTL-CTERM motif
MKLASSVTCSRFAACIALLFLALPTHATIIGVQANSVYSIDEATAADVLLNANPGADALLGALAKNSAGVLYGAGTSNRLWTVDPVTGVLTQGPQLSGVAVDSGQIRALAFNAGDVLYAIQGNITSTPPFTLLTIDAATGVRTVVGPVNGAIQGMEFSPTGTLYGWDVQGAGLVIINPATGAVTDVNPAIGGGPEVQTLAFSPGGVLYGAGGSNLYTIDTTTGALTLVGAFNPPVGIPGMEFVAGAPPAPAVSLTPASLGFGNQQVATTSAAQPLTLQNVGTGVLNIASIVPSGDFAQTNNCAATLAASASCTINVTFTPTTTGLRSGSVSVTSDASGSPHSSSLSGTGTSTPPPPPPPPSHATASSIPTLSEWALIGLMTLVMYVGWMRLRKVRGRG